MSDKEKFDVRKKVIPDKLQSCSTSVLLEVLVYKDISSLHLGRYCCILLQYSFYHKLDLTTLY